MLLGKAKRKKEKAKEEKVGRKNEKEDENKEEMEETEAGDQSRNDLVSLQAEFDCERQWSSCLSPSF